MKTLGLDLGTNSIGWAIVERKDGTCKLLDRGVHIFQEGVAREKGNEKPAVQDRTNARAMRRHYFRRRLQKVNLLKVLSANDMCPPLSEEELKEWRNGKRYPANEAFREWQRTDDNCDRNPYHDRNDALHRRFDLSQRSERFKLGRALYHLAQRRGFLSNRKDLSKKSEGDVQKGIDELSAEIHDAGCEYVGEYFYKLYGTGLRIRGRYTHRTQHAEREFYAICSKQELPEDLVKKLHRAIFYQRPLKSQKGLVGRCTFEPSKARCAVSHPLFEEFRMLCFLNNIKIKEGPGYDYLPLDECDRQTAMGLFMRKSKPEFPFEDIAKKIAGKGNYAFRDDPMEFVRKFNFRMSTSVAGCPVTASLKSLFGDDWREVLYDHYALRGTKSREQVVDDVWHALHSFGSEELLAKWAQRNLGLDENDAKTFAQIPTPQGYASLSLKAIRKMLALLRRGMRYDEAVFVANLGAVFYDWDEKTDAERDAIADGVCDTLINFKPAEFGPATTKEGAIRSYLEDQEGVAMHRLDRLYHPSKIDTYPAAQVDARGRLRLGSPRTSSVRNPMAMRALFRLRHLINELLDEGKIDRTTRINIEFARGLNDANMRRAIEQYQRDKEAEHRKYADEIKKLYREACGHDIEPTDTDVLKYTLWIEQDRRCLYTGRQIAITDFLGPMPAFDIEHTIPRSLGGDDSQANKTLCDARFNREVKRAKLPAQLECGPSVLNNIEALGWNKKIEDLANQVARLKASGNMEKEAKDRLIQKRHYLRMQLDYWRDKVARFKMTEVPQGFTNRQGVDIGIIGRYAREYLRTVFRSEDYQVFTVKGATTAEFRKMWGLQEEFSAKERVNHCHHTIDAIVIACIGREEYRRWAEFRRDTERYEFDGAPRPHFDKPWSTFTEDVKAVADSLIVSHHTPDNRLKASKKKLRKRGRIVRGADGQPLYAQGDTARARLHNETFYGAIMRDDQVRYVLRVPLSSLKETDVAKIVDPAVRAAVEAAIELRGFKNLCGEPVYLNRAKGVEIKRVRIFQPSVTSPIHLKKHRDLSAAPYKQHFHVANDSNFAMGIYEGTDAKGKRARSFKLVNNLEAARKRKAHNEIMPLSDEHDYPLRYVLKKGTMVLMYEKSPQELYEATQTELSRRLYKVTGLSSMVVGNSSYGTISFLHHEEARPASDPAVKAKNGVWKINETLRPAIKMLHTQLNMLVEGFDFTLTTTGEIRFKR